MTSFHETLFPLDVALGARGDPERRTDVVTLGSRPRKPQCALGKFAAAMAGGLRRENARRSRGDHRLLRGAARQALWIPLARQGRLLVRRAGRDRDAARPDDRTGRRNQSAIRIDEDLGASFAPYVRAIAKPVAGSVRIAVAGAETSAFTLDATTGMVTFAAAPAAGAAISAGFRFDVPVQFDTDFLEIDHSAFEAGEIPNIPVIEIRP